MVGGAGQARINLTKRTHARPDSRDEVRHEQEDRRRRTRPRCSWGCRVYQYLNHSTNGFPRSAAERSSGCAPRPNSGSSTASFDMDKVLPPDNPRKGPEGDGVSHASTTCWFNDFSGPFRLQPSSPSPFQLILLKQQRPQTPGRFICSIVGLSAERGSLT